ncbi:uncharacterized protein LOC111693227 [Trichogramma pretiosum]|uniref:uncharacterized protein LOC111693227 n=1 Tax=Trichogramma pretiosum TaxID=7493 RepID=UPI000C71916C|nr:uncharacterized protein LOC111693227 [Trichogramma pretiosum]
MSKHKKLKRRHRERSHRRKGHKRRHRSRDSSSSTDYSPRYKRRRSYSPGETSDESKERSYPRESRSRSYSRGRSSNNSKSTGHTPPRSRERSPEKVEPAITDSTKKTTDNNSPAAKKEVRIASSVTVVENPSTDGKAEHNPQSGATDTPLKEKIVNVLGCRLKEDKEFSPAVHSHFVSIWKDIVQLGLPNDDKKELIKKYPIPINCEFLETPKLNKEMEVNVNEVCKTRDKRIAEKQDKCVAVITSLSKVLSHMISIGGIDNDEDVPHIEAVSDAIRLCLDSFHEESSIRRSLVISHINVSWKDILMTTEVDEFLFGKDLTEVAKKARATGQEMKGLAKKTSENNSKNTKTPSRPFNRPQTETYAGPSQRQSSRSQSQAQTQKNRKPYRSRRTSPKQNYSSNSNRSHSRHSRKN